MSQDPSRSVWAANLMHQVDPASWRSPDTRAAEARMSALPPTHPPRTASCHVLRARSPSTPSRSILPAHPPVTSSARALSAHPPGTSSPHFLCARALPAHPPVTSSARGLPAPPPGTFSPHTLGKRPPRTRSACALPAQRTRAPSPPVAPRPRTESPHRQSDSRKLDSGHGGSPRRDCPNCARRYWGAGRVRPPGGPRPPARSSSHPGAPAHPRRVSCCAAGDGE